jgi:hypothetical protein
VDDLTYVAMVAGLAAVTGLLVWLCDSLAEKRGEQR